MANTEQKGINKLYRIRQYLLSTSGYAQGLSLEQIIGMAKAERILMHLQLNYSEIL
jgi:hypothetical protein